VGGTLLAFGGYSAGVTGVEGARQAFRFDLPEGPWRRVADLGHDRTFSGSCVIDDTVYAVGGVVERYETEADRWSVVIAGAPLPRSHVAVAAWRDRIHVIGGVPPAHAGHHVVDPARGRVSAAEPPPGFVAGDHLHVLAVLPDGLHCVGGLRGEPGALSDAHHVWDGGRWTPRSSAPESLFAKFAVHAVVEGRLFFFDEAKGLCYDPDTDAWTRLDPLPVWRAMPAGAVVAGRLHVIGGRPVRDDDRHGVHVFDPATGRWTTAR
jgi:hypothetical protein